MSLFFYGLDFVSYRDHVAPRTILFNYIDVQRQTKTSIVSQDATIDDHWNMDGEKSLCEVWIGVTRFVLLKTNSPLGYVWVYSRLTKQQVTTRPGTMVQKNGLACRKTQGRKNPNENWTQRESTEACTSQCTMQKKSAEMVGVSDALHSQHPCASDPSNT